MRGAAALFVFVLAGCAAPVPDGPCTPVEAQAPGVAGALGHLGERVEVQFFWDSRRSCGERSANVGRASVELFDADNLPVAAQASAPLRRERGGGESFETTVSFTPEKLGAYYAVVSFEPEGGLAQGGLSVVDDRRAEAPALSTRTPGAVCVRLQPLASGSFACEQPERGVVLFRGAERVAEWSRATFREAGGALWLSPKPYVLARVAEQPDGTLAEVERVTSSFQAFAATDDHALLWATDKLEGVRFDGAALIDEGRRGPFGNDVTAFAFDASAQTVVAATAHNWARFWVEDAAVEWKEGAGALHQSDDGVWLENDADGSLRFAPAAARRPVIDAWSPVGWRHVRAREFPIPGDRPLVFPLRLLGPADLYPSLDRTEVLVPQLSDGAVVWLHFKAPPGSTFQEVSGGWLRASNGEAHDFFKL
jgi:hypothetical protein